MRYQSTINNALQSKLTAMEKVNAQRSLLNPEDNASSYISAYNKQIQIDKISQYTANATNAQNWLNATADQLTQLITLIQNVSTNYGIGGSNDVNSAESLQALAGDVLGIYNSLLDIANSTYMGRYLFSGYQTTTQPFTTGSNSVSAISAQYGSGVSFGTNEAYSDLSELASGQYTVKVDIKGDTGYLTLYDKNGNKVIIDSNGSDDSSNTGNFVSTQMTFKVEAGAVINTGRGLTIQLPDDISSSTTGYTYTLNYTAGSTSNYNGDSGEIATMIGAIQSLVMNITGDSIFTSTNKELTSTIANLVNGVAVTSSTLFSQLYGAVANVGDSITISGTDHMGRVVGSAQVSGTENVNLNMNNASVEERTLIIGYAGKYYSVEIPAKGYESMDELMTTIQTQLKSATYLGSQDIGSYYENTDQLSDAINGDINSRDFTASGTVDLSSEISIYADGDQLCFATTSVGDMTSLSVTGYKHNTLGFNDKTVAATGSDTTFDIGQTYSLDGIYSLSTTHSNIDLSGSVNNSVTFVVNGQTVIVNNLNSAATLEEKELLIDKALQKAGLGYGVTATLTDLGGGNYDVTFNQQNFNYDSETLLTSTYIDPTGLASDYQSSGLPIEVTTAKNQSIGDLMSFIENLYGNSVSVSIDSGKLVVTDLVSGSSKLTMNIIENNEGIGVLTGSNLPAVVSGSYTGSKSDEWTINSTMTLNADGTRTVNLSVLNSKGNEIYTSTINNYMGEEISIGYGVAITLGDMELDALNPTASASYSLSLSSNSSLSFGDMAVTNTGDNVDIFSSVMNLYNALMSGINEGVVGSNGIGAPSSWTKEVDGSAVPYFSGTFTGNSNTTWTNTVTSSSGKTSAYVQNEFVSTTGSLNYSSALGASSLDFSLQVYDNTTGSFKSYSVSVDLTNVTNEQELAAAIAKTINNNDTLYAAGIHATVNSDGTVSFESGSGAKTIQAVPADENATYMLGMKSSSSTLGTEFSENESFDVKYYDTATSSWNTATVTVPAGSYSSTADVLSVINSQLGGTGITAGIYDGQLTFSSSTGDAFYYENVVSSGGLGIGNSTANYINASSGTQLDMTTLTDEERTLTFKYTSGGTDQYVTITLDALGYDSIDDVISAINDKLTDAGAGSAITAVRGTDGTLSFATAAGVTAVVEGDYAGTLGFPKTGDEVTVKVTDSNGNLVQTLHVKSANEEYYVADGVYAGYDAGSLTLQDSFDVAVGSGSQYELDILQQAETQLILAQVQIGNLLNRVETTLTYNTKITETYELQKAETVGGSSTDIVLLTSELQIANTAYESALQVASLMMSVSILDYLTA